VAFAHGSLRRGAAAAVLSVALGSLTACQNSGAIGDVLGSVLGGQAPGGQRGAQLAGTIAGVDTRGQQIGVQQRNGETVGIGYDGNTRVVFQNQTYPVTALERGDQVVVRVLDRGNGAYYTDSVHVTQSVSAAGGGASGGASGGSATVQAFEGVVRQIDRNNGLFSLDVRGGGTVIVSLPYGARRADVDRFQGLRPGEAVRVAGVFLNSTRVELRQFY
jgi:hypothetical protein